MSNEKKEELVKEVDAVELGLNAYTRNHLGLRDGDRLMSGVVNGILIYVVYRRHRNIIEVLDSNCGLLSLDATAGLDKDLEMNRLLLKYESLKEYGEAN